MIRLLIFFGLAYLLYRLVRPMLTSALNPKDQSGEGGSVSTMVQDPYCESYVPERDAIRKVISGKEYYFCSQECLEKFVNENKRGERT